MKVAVSGAGRTSTFGDSPSTIGVGILNVPARTFGETVTAVETTGAGIEKIAVSGEAVTSTYRSAVTVGVGILNTAVRGRGNSHVYNRRTFLKSDGNTGKV